MEKISILNLLNDSGDREELMARQEFIQQLSLWGEEDDRKETKRKVPIPGQHKTEFFDPFTQTSKYHPHLRS